MLALLVGLAPTERPVAGYMRVCCLAEGAGKVKVSVGKLLTVWARGAAPRAPRDISR
ncbi:hypothetical protein EPIB2_742 [Tritonibacter mobilis]|nr:hypothetical protein SCH4B_3861 [Ruegeria sp. TrichCH4B]VCU61665.1 hypothetical protein EPIB2_742 [Tritonibacter mobilis]